MGVYIPNMEKPKSCRDCDLLANDQYDDLYCVLLNESAERLDEILDDCPLIEIDDEEMNGLINLYKICKGASEVKSIQLKDIKPVVF